MIPAATYVFKHALVRDAAYESLLKRRRQELHARLFAFIFQTLRVNQAWATAVFISGIGIEIAHQMLWNTFCRSLGETKRALRKADKTGTNRFDCLLIATTYCYHPQTPTYGGNL